MSTNTYPGGKAGPGVWQRLISDIPPHDVYIAPFAGRDAIARYKRPANRTILIDRDPEPLKWWAQASLPCELHICCGIEWMRHHFQLTRFEVAKVGGFARQFVFLDPPYPMATRTSGPLYKHELSDDQHWHLLDVIKRVPAMVMITSYPNELYAKQLAKWRTWTYYTVTRSGERRLEQAWCNYPKPEELHDPRFIGRDKREREKINRRIRRLSSKLKALPPIERQAILNAVASIE